MIFSILTVFCVGLSTGGLLVSRRIDPHPTLFIIVGVAFFLFTYIGLFIGMRLAGFLSTSAMSLFFGLVCLGMIGFLLWRFNPAFGYVKQEPASFAVFLLFFLLLGMDLALISGTLWLSILFTAIFVGGLFLGFMMMYRIIHRHRVSPIIRFIPIIPLLFISLFKLI